MLEHAEEIMVGVSILMKAVKVNKAFIGMENNKPDAIQLMTKVASSYAGIEVVPLKVQYLSLIHICSGVNACFRSTFVGQGCFCLGFQVSLALLHLGYGVVVLSLIHI